MDKSSLKPLLLPLKVHWACSDKGKCKIASFLNKTAHSVWQIDMFDWASYTCRPTECVRADPGTRFDVFANVMVLFGSLLNAVIFAGLPFVWALTGWACFNGFQSAPKPPPLAATTTVLVGPIHPVCLCLAMALGGVQDC